MACVFLCDTEHGLGQHYFPDDNLQQCLCAQIYGERNYKDLGYLQEVKHICTDDEKSERRKRAEAMNSHIVFGKATDKDRAKARHLWEQNGKRASWGCAWFQKWFDRVKTAVDQGQKLKVVFFPGHVGCGKVPWTMLPKVNLWDGIGCGGSQKGEIAKLDEMRRTDRRWDYDEVDVTEFLAEQFKPGDIVDAFDLDQNSFVTAELLQMPTPEDAKNHHDHYDMKWQVVCQKTGKCFETKRLRHATDFFEKLLELNVFGKDSLKKIVQDVTKLHVKSVHESRLQNGMPCLAVDFDIQNIQEKHRLRDAVLSDDIAFLLNNALEKRGITEELAVDNTSFFNQYAASLLSSSQLTNHQAEKLKELSRYLHEDVHLSAPAGAGKSFLAIRHAISKLSSSSQGKILFISPNRSLGFYFVRWLLTYAKSSLPTMSRNKLLQRVVLMHAPYDRFTGVHIEDCQIVLQELTVMPDDLVLAVFDEGHEIFRTNQRLFQEVRAQHKLILSDLSQSFLLDNNYPEMRRVNLTEVVRSTKRVAFGANAFQLQDGEPTTCLGTTGPPLKSFIFEVPEGYDGDLFAHFAQNTVEALWFILQRHPSMRLDRHVALLVPDEHFHMIFKSHLEERLEAVFAPTYNIQLVSFEESLRFLPEAVHQDRREDELILDWDTNAKGLEQLFIICIGFDAQITGDTDNFNRARLYHAMTRAQLQAIVVDRFIRGGWLEFLNALKLKETTFQADDAKLEIKKDAALKIVEDSRPETVPGKPTKQENHFFHHHIVF